MTKPVSKGSFITVVSLPALRAAVSVLALAVFPLAGLTACAASGDLDAASSAGGSSTSTASQGGSGASGGSGGSGGSGVVDPVGGSGGGGECGASEVCVDGLDNDCNGKIDDDCPCEPGTELDCYEGPLEAAGKGQCALGKRYCEPKGEFPTWGPCSGWVAPATELCDSAKIDEDCNGIENDGCECTDEEVLPCGDDTGECVAGTQTCSMGKLGPCVGEVGPGVEACNGKDDDCNGQVDDGLTQACGSNVGECKPGTSTCADGVWGVCAGEVAPAAETCNNKDDDCDGQKDEQLAKTCGTNEGECSEGTETCAAGVWGVCTGIGPKVEVCNTKDDDCDGQTDEGCGCVDGTVKPCGTDDGECKAGTQTCAMGVWGACLGSVGPTVETCNNKDDDCDNAIDDGLTKACGTDVGECISGTSTCALGVYGPCVGSVGPVTETCNNKDDDCDAITDESLVKQCGTTDVGACQYGSETCNLGAWGMCVGSINAVKEICANGIDDDCDGMIDETVECPNSLPLCTCPPIKITSAPLKTETLTASCSDPDGGVMKYQWVVTQAPMGSASQPAMPNAASTTFFVDLAGTYVLTLTATDDENTTAKCTTTIDAIPPQDIHVELVWDKAYGDADLHLIQVGVNPTGAWFTSEADCFFGNTSATWPPNGADGNASLDIDDTDGFGPENINILKSPQNGTYNIGVAYFCQRSVQQMGEPPINLGQGPTVATVKVFCGGQLAATYGNIQLDKTGRFVHVATITWPGCAGMSINNATWTSLVQPKVYPDPLHCQLPCTKDADCGGGEFCKAGLCDVQ